MFNRVCFTIFTCKMVMNQSPLYKVFDARKYYFLVMFSNLQENGLEAYFFQTDETS